MAALRYHLRYVSEHSSKIARLKYAHVLTQRLYSNQRTRNQFRPRNANKGTTSYQLRQYAEATLGGGSLRKTVKLPEGEDENEWLAVYSKDTQPSTLTMY
jgi:hypothetical protein